MEIKLNKGDQIQIPVGHKAVIRGDMIIIEEEKKEFKDGDILSVTLSNGMVTSFIYKDTDEVGFYKFYIGVNGFGSVVHPGKDSRWGRGTRTYATEEEKQYLFNKLKEQGLYWDATTKQLKKIIVRAKPGGRYLFIDSFGIVHESTDFYCPQDNKYYDSGNYYPPREQEQAEKDAVEIRKVYERRFKI